MSNVYTVNGTNLTNLARYIEVAEGLHDTPGPRGDDVVVPGAHGTLDLNADSAQARRRYGPGSITFRMNVAGVDPGTGLPGVDPEDPALFLDRVDELAALFHKRSLTIVHERDDGDRRCVARLAKPLQVVRELSSPLFGRFVAECVIPGGFWRDTSDTTVTDTTVSTGDTLDVSTLCGNAPCTDAVITLGPISNPMVTQGSTYLQYNGVVSSGRQLVVNTGTWSLDDGSGTAWTPSPEAIAYGPGPSWFEIDPLLSTSLTVTHTGGGTASVSITAARQWLTS